LAGCLSNGVLSADYFRLQPVGTEPVQPGLMLERMVPHLVSALDDAPQQTSVTRIRCIRSDHEEGELDPGVVERVERERYDGLEVTRTRAPTRIAVRPEVGPEVVQVERDAGEGAVR
jgi:hypothetical protein